MFERLREIGQEIGDLVSWIAREQLDSRQASALLTKIGQIESSCAAARVLLSGRISESTHWQQSGERSAAHWVARATRTTVSKAAETIETAKRLDELRRTSEAFQKGQVSETQVREIASAASLDPSSENKLLETARTGDVTALRDACRRVRHAAVTDELARYEASTEVDICGAGAITTERFGSMPSSRRMPEPP